MKCVLYWTSVLVAGLLGVLASGWVFPLSVPQHDRPAPKPFQDKLDSDNKKLGTFETRYREFVDNPAGTLIDLTAIRIGGKADEGLVLSLLLKLGETEPLNAINLASTHLFGNVRDEAIESLAILWMFKDKDEFYKNLSETGDNEYWKTLGWRSAAKIDTDHVLDRWISLEEGPYRRRALGELGASLVLRSEKHGQLLVDKTMSRIDNANEKSIAALAITDAITYSYPALGVDLLENVKEGHEKDGAVRSVLNGLLRTTPEKGFRWLEASLLENSGEEGIRTQAKSYCQEWVDRDYIGARKLFQNLEVSPLKKVLQEALTKKTEINP